MEVSDGIQKTVMKCFNIRRK